MTKLKFTIEAEMEERWVPHFLGMLNHMERLGKIGSSRTVSIYSDGDGDFRPKFTWNIESDLANPIVDNEGDVMYDAE